MNAIKTYQQELKNPQWQKKRLKIMERDSFHCRCCINDKSELHVHHLKYKANKKPWEYPNDQLLTICLLCHSLLHNGTFKICGEGNDLTLIYGSGGQDISLGFHNEALKWFEEKQNRYKNENHN